MCVCHTRQVRERHSDLKATWTVLNRWPDNKNPALLFWSHTFRLCLSHAHVHTHSLTSSVWCFFSPFHTQTPPPPTFPSLPPLVDAPNKATCVVSGCLGERSPCQPAGRVYQGTVSTPARCSALFSFPLLLLFIPHICHPCHPSHSLLWPLLLIPHLLLCPLFHAFFVFLLSSSISLFISLFTSFHF